MSSTATSAVEVFTFHWHSVLAAQVSDATAGSTHCCSAEACWEPHWFRLNHGESSVVISYRAAPCTAQGSLLPISCPLVRRFNQWLTETHHLLGGPSTQQQQQDIDGLDATSDRDASAGKRVEGAIQQCFRGSSGIVLRLPLAAVANDRTPGEEIRWANAVIEAHERVPSMMTSPKAASTAAVTLSSSSSSSMPSGCDEPCNGRASTGGAGIASWSRRCESVVCGPFRTYTAWGAMKRFEVYFLDDGLRRWLHQEFVVPAVAAVKRRHPDKKSTMTVGSTQPSAGDFFALTGSAEVLPDARHCGMSWDATSKTASICHGVSSVRPATMLLVQEVGMEIKPKSIAVPEAPSTSSPSTGTPTQHDDEHSETALRRIRRYDAKRLHCNPSMRLAQKAVVKMRRTHLDGDRREDPAAPTTVGNAASGWTCCATRSDHPEEAISDHYCPWDLFYGVPTHLPPDAYPSYSHVDAAAKPADLDAVRQHTKEACKRQKFMAIEHLINNSVYFNAWQRRGVAPWSACNAGASPTSSQAVLPGWAVAVLKALLVSPAGPLTRFWHDVAWPQLWGVPDSTASQSGPVTDIESLYPAVCDAMMQTAATESSPDASPMSSLPSTSTVPSPVALSSTANTTTAPTDALFATAPPSSAVLSTARMIRRFYDAVSARDVSLMFAFALMDSTSTDNNHGDNDDGDRRRRKYEAHHTGQEERHLERVAEEVPEWDVQTAATDNHLGGLVLSLVPASSSSTLLPSLPTDKRDPEDMTSATTATHQTVNVISVSPAARQLVVHVRILIVDVDDKSRKSLRHYFQQDQDVVEDFLRATTGSHPPSMS